MKLLIILLSIGISGCSIIPEKPVPNKVAELAPSSWQDGIFEFSSNKSEAQYSVQDDKFLIDLIEASFKTNYSVLKARFDSLEASSVYDQVSGSIFPSVSYSDTYTKGDSGFGISKTRNQSASVNQGISFLGELRAARQMQESLINSNLLAEQQAKLTLIDSISAGYLSAKSYFYQKTVVDRLLSKALKNKEYVEISVKSGILPKSAIIEAESQILSYTSQLVSIKRELDITLKSLEYLTRYSSAQIIEAISNSPPSYLSNIVLQISDVPADVISNRIDVLTAKENVMYSIRNYQYVWGQKLPKFSLVGSISLRTTIGALSPAMGASNKVFGWSIGPSLSFNIFDPTQKPKENQASIQYDKSVLAYKDSIVVAANDIEKSGKAFNYDLELFNIAASEFSRSLAEFNNQSEKLSAGLTSQYLVNQASINKDTAELAVISKYFQMLQSNAKFLTSTNTWTTK